PYPVRNALNWFALSAATANVVMQLSLLPVGRGVAESKVESGRVDKHPIKRARTTLSYIAVAWHGTDAEREAMRKEIDKQHRQVVSPPSHDVKYNAFDRKLQLWVAACLWRGTLDIVEILYGGLNDAAMDALYDHASRLATTLQVPADMWPADRVAFDEYWQGMLDSLEMDDVTRPYLQNLATLGDMPAPVRRTLGSTSRV
ncbi:oxygenase MpaB family protein, partial [Actinomadura adrarensis]